MTAAGPRPGDVFREYVWQAGSNITLNAGPGAEYAVPGVLDLAEATRAEVVVEFANVHLMVWGQAIQVNGSEWFPIPFPLTTPDEACAYFNMVAQTVPLPLSVFQSEGSTFRLKVDPGRQKGWTQIYDVTFRLYYDAAKKPHATGRIVSPTDGAALGLDVALTLEAQHGEVVSVDYIGDFENVDVDGDGIYTGWQYGYFHGQLVRHIGTSSSGPDFAVAWRTAWVPDQRRPLRLAARVLDNRGLYSISEAVEALTFDREFSVELCRPIGVPAGYTSCTYGTGVSPDPATMTQRFRVEGDLARLVDAQLVCQLWKRHTFWGMKINGIDLTDLAVEGGGPLFLRRPVRPLQALAPGTNVLDLNPARDGGTDCQWPGVQLLLRYR